MNILGVSGLSIILTLREEFVCLIFLIFMICYHIVYKSKDENKEGRAFLKLSFYAFLHVLLDIITIITVNNLDLFPALANKWLHIAFYCVGIMFVVEFLDYAVKLTMSHRALKQYRRVKLAPVLIILLLSFVLPIEYVKGRGTNYSYGPLLFVCYGIFAACCVAAVVLVMVNRKKLEKKVRLAVLPTVALMMVMIAVQAVVPELLMTGACVTLVCLGFFVTVDNPVSAYVEQALWDNATGVRNKNSYENQLSVFEKKYRAKTLDIGFIVCDLNGLKYVNDNHGHAEGDKLIKAAATVLLDNLEAAYNVYRTGGDEFVVIYLSTSDEVVGAEMKKVREACDSFTDCKIKLSVAMGYASGTVDYAGIKDIYNRADELMYENKAETKRKNPELCR